MSKNNLTAHDKEKLNQGSILGSRKFKQASILAVVIMVMLGYSQWEIPTLLHGREFDNDQTLDEVSYKTGSWLFSPKFIKVINYSDKKADVLWVMDFGNHDTHTWVEFIKKESKSGKMEWVVDTWRECTPANGTPRCFFPWYGGISINY